MQQGQDALTENIDTKGKDSKHVNRHNVHVCKHVFFVLQILYWMESSKGCLFRFVHNVL